MRNRGRLAEATAAVACIASLVGCSRSGQAPSGGFGPRVGPPNVLASRSGSFSASASGFAAQGKSWHAEVSADGEISLSLHRAPMAPGLKVRTESIGRDSSTPLGSSLATLGEDGSLRFQRPNAEEVLRQAPQGIEQSWTWLHAPAGSGDLIALVRFEGAASAKPVDGNLLFADRAGTAVFGYRDAYWVDAAGRRTRISIELDGALARLVVPARLVDASPFPASLDPTIGPANEVAPGDTLPGDGTASSIASDGQTDVFAWMGPRVTRANPDGTLIDPFGIAMPSTFGVNGLGITFDGTQYWLAWYAASSPQSVFAQRFAVDGGWIDTVPLFLGNAAGGAQPVQLAALDGTALAVWNGPLAGTSNTVYGARLAADGTVLDPGGGFLIAQVGTQAPTPVVATTDTEFLVVWSDSRAGQSIFGARVGLDGTVQDPGGLQLTDAGAAVNPAVAFGRGGALVAWEQIVGWNIWGEWLTPGLQPAGPPFQLTATAGSSAISGPVAAGNPEGVCVGWNLFGGYATLVADAGPQVLNGVPLGQGLTAIAAHEAGFVFSLAGYGQHMDSAGSLLNSQPYVVIQRDDTEWSPSVASSGSDYLVAWSDYQPGTNSYFPGSAWGVRLGANGAPLDPTPLPILSTGITPELSFDGINYVALFNTSQGTNSIFSALVMRIAPDGGVLDPGGIPVPVCGSPRTPVVPFQGSWYFLQTCGDQMYLTQLAPDGGVLSAPGARIGDSTSVKDGFLLGSNGNEMLAAWSESTGVLGARVSADAGVLDPNAVPLPGIGPVTGIQVIGNDFFISGNGAIRVFDDGGLQSQQIADGTTCPASAQTFATGAFGYDGQYLLCIDSTGVVWRLSLDGGSPGPGIRAIPASDDFQSLGVATVGGGNALLAYAHYASTPLGQQWRVVTRTWSEAPGPDGTGCDSSADCASGYCVDGVCCDSPCGGGSSTDRMACSVAAGGAVDGTCGPLKQGQQCRASQGPCDTNGFCDGTSLQCPPHVYLDAGTLCYAGGSCNDNIYCAGGPQCPVVFYDAGTTCNPQNLCVLSAQCNGSGTCEDLQGVICPPATPCIFIQTCNPSTGLCVPDYAPPGWPCLIDTCTVGSCNLGVCGGGQPVVCPSFPCQIGSCDPFAGGCVWTPLPDGAACNSGNACIVGSVCSAGECDGGGPVVCAPPPLCRDAGACDPDAGQCLYAPLPDGAGCGSGGACQSGSCIGADAGADAGPGDAGAPDSGTRADAGSDGGARDAGAGRDAGAVRRDAGSPADAGTPQSPTGGGCGSAASPPGPASLILALAAWVARRRGRFQATAATGGE
jgi:hypothetical protein